MYFYKNFFLNKLFLVSRINLLLFYFLYLLLIICSSIIFCNLFINQFPEIIDNNFNLVLKNMQFQFGDLIHNFYYNHSYSQKDHNDIIFQLRRLPAVVFIISFLYNISKNFYFIIIFKNIIFFSIFYITSYKLLINSKNNFLAFFLVILTPILIPYNFYVALNFTYEDFIISILLPLLYLSLISNYVYKYLIISSLLFILYFTKTSMFFLVLILPLLIFFFDKEKKKLKFLPFFVCLLAILIWGFYGLHKTGRFPFASSGSTDNSRSLSSAFNIDFHNYYPEKSTDLIPLNNDLPKNVKSEWEFYDFYNVQNKNYLENNIKRYFFDFFIKAKFIFFGVHRDGALPDKSGLYDNNIRYSLVFNKIFFNLSIIFATYFLIKNFKKIDSKDFYFFLIVFLNLLPHLYGWATSRHLVPVNNVAIIYLILRFNNKIDSVNN